MEAHWVQQRHEELRYLAEDLSDDPKSYTQWEANFILSVEAQKERGRGLSEKQLLKIKELFDKHNVVEDDDDEPLEDGDTVSNLPPF